MRIKLFTHTDLDGIGCAVLAKYVFGAENVDVVYCNYDDVNEKVTSFLEAKEFKNIGDYEKIFITDISVNDTVAKYIDATYEVCGSDFIQLLDHHKTAELLNQYVWADVREYAGINKKNCGTFAFYEYLTKNDCFECWDLHMENAEEFAEIVRQYDTWEWKTVFNNEIPKKYEGLLRIIGRDEFVDTMVERLTNFETPLVLTAFDEKLLYYRQKEIDVHIWSKKKHMIRKQFKGYDVGIVFSDRYTSEIGDVILSSMPELDIIMIINPSYAVSYRTAREGIDVSAIAKELGGGGHAKASASPVTEDMKLEIIKLLLGV
jgi:oligoribonuclease NrnB/cAMP/cGMP phosphodiesterase (DHH superfamily)